MGTPLGYPSRMHRRHVVQRSQSARFPSFLQSLKEQRRDGISLDDQRLEREVWRSPLKVDGSVFLNYIGIVPTDGPPIKIMPLYVGRVMLYYKLKCNGGLQERINDRQAMRSLHDIAKGRLMVMS